MVAPGIVGIQPEQHHCLASHEPLVWCCESLGINALSWQLITVGDVAYFGAIVPNSAASEDRELHAYNVTNQTAWTVTDLNTNATTGAKSYGLFLLNDVLYFKARVGLDNGHSCVAHAPANATTWIKDDGFKCPADFGTSTTKKAWIGGILYSGASAYNPDNQTSWYVINSTRTGGAGTYTYVAVGDVLYFSGARTAPGTVDEAFGPTTRPTAPRGSLKGATRRPPTTRRHVSSMHPAPLRCSSIL